MRTRVHRSRVSHDRWLVSYADFITLLFAFFVVLYASANADKKKQQDVSSAIDAAFRSLGIFSDATRKPSTAAGAQATADHPVVPMNIVMGEDVLSPAAVKDDLERIRRDLTQALSDQVATPHRLHQNGARRIGHQPARSGILCLRLGGAQARNPADSAADCRAPGRNTLRSANRRAHRQYSQFITANSIRTGSSLRRAPRILRA